MTETSPVGGMAHPPAGVELGTRRGARLADEVRPARRRRADAHRRPTTATVLPWDGEAVGEIEVRGPWITGAYHLDAGAGEVRRRLAAHRRHRHDRRRAASSRSPTARRTSSSPAASGSRRSSWRTCSPRRPTCSRRRSSASPTRSGPSARWPASCRAATSSTRRRWPSSSTARSRRWQVPENWAFIDEVPKTSVGKFDKKVLRARYADGDIEVAHTKAPGGK